MCAAGGGAIKICCAVGGGASPARDFTATRNLRVNRIYGFPLWGKLSPQVTDEGENCDCRTIPRRGGVTPPYGAIKKHGAVGAGQAPPAVLRLQQHNGYSVGAAYMPPVAATPAMRTNGQTPRDAFMRPLQTCRKYRTITGLRNSKNTPPRRGGH